MFDHHGDDTWTLPKDKLVGYFRATDKTSDAVGNRQAAVFQAFAGLAGYEPVGSTGKTTSPKSAKAARTPAAAKKPAKATKVVEQIVPQGNGNKRDMALTVRIEINLPAEGTRETYDHIFQSIRANLIDD